MTLPAVRVEGLDKLRRQLAALETRGAKRAVANSHKLVAKFVEQSSRGRGDRRQQAAARALLGRGTPRHALIAIRNTARVPFGKVAFLGALRRTGWAVGRGRRQQHLPWVGNRWDLERGIGPYVLRDVLRDERDEIVETFGRELREAARRLGIDVTVWGG